MPAKRKPETKPSKAAGGKKAVDEKVLEETPADKLRAEGLIATYAAQSKKVHRNVRDIAVSNLTVTYHGTPLIEEAELTLNYGNRYGYIGRNGCGKSTFMRVIAARCFPIPEGIDIFHLKEEIEATEMTAKEAVMSVDKERALLEKEAEELNDVVAADDGNEEAMDRLTQVYERLEELDAATAETRASKILSGLGFTPETQQKKTKDFSGGWRMRIALARALFIQPTLLLLDEPTNHLDMEAVVWLEDYLSKWNKILFMVSHSQDFMNTVCTHMVHHTKGKTLSYYSGNYDQFVITRMEKSEEQEKRFKSEQDQIKHMKDYVARFGQGNAKMARQAQSKEKILDKMLKGGLTEKADVEKALDFKFPDCGKISPPVLQCNDISFGYPGCEILYEGVDFGIDLDSRVALVGPNGAGKSTLLKIMTGDLLPLTGSVRPHAHLRISKFTQHFIDALDLSMAPLDYFMQLWPDLTREDGRKFLGRFGISGAVQTQIMGHLSDGQKSRVVLAKMAKETPHLLLLDEPTNHLDMESIDSLAKAVNQFSGGMVLVSHDMRLISQVAQEIWMCDHRTVKKFPGDIRDFKMKLRRQMNLEEGGAAAAASAKSLAPPKTAPLAPLGYAPPLAPIRHALGQAKPTSSDFPPLAPAGGAKKGGAVSEQDLILQARLELAEMAIAKQRARKAQEAGGSAEGAAIGAADSVEVGKTAAEDGGNGAAVGDGEDDEAKLKEQEKALAKAKRKAEKEAIAARNKLEEEERERRRLEKLRDHEEAMRLKEEEAKRFEEFLAAKAIKDAKKKAEEDAEAALLAEAIRVRREEKEARKKARAEVRAAEVAAAKAAAEARVMADPWTQDQQIAFETALLTFTSFVEKNERWTKIAAAVPVAADGEKKSKNQCLARYRFLKEYVAQRLKMEAAAKADT